MTCAKPSKKKAAASWKGGGGVACEFTVHFIKLISQERNTDIHTPQVESQ